MKIMRLQRRASARGRYIAIAAAIALPIIVVAAALAAPPIYDEGFVNYYSNAHVYITDPFDNSGTAPWHEICAMLYVFDTRQALQECCGCPVSRDGLLVL